MKNTTVDELKQIVAGLNDEDRKAEQLLAAAHFLRDEAAHLSLDHFALALFRTIGANREYSRDVFVAFQNNPAAFLAHRQPQTQSQEIIRAMLHNRFLREDFHLSIPQ